MDFFRHYRKQEILPLNPLQGGAGVGKNLISDNVFYTGISPQDERNMNLT
jgi:hypothetical protein